MVSASVGGGGTAFAVDPSDLDAAAKVAHDTGGAIPAELTTIQKPSDDAVGGLLGWQTAGSLSSCTSAWEDCLRALGTEVDGVGDKLTKTAASYRDTDTNAANSFPWAGK
ncbi:uncharacterized protein YukE [Kitasatospora sp. GP30]|nr:uncharacterized protein YukE [Kitasatospora sp. GP30]